MTERESEKERKVYNDKGEKREGSVGVSGHTYICIYHRWMARETATLLVGDYTPLSLSQVCFFHFF